jgi:hypothetical protein
MALKIFLLWNKRVWYAMENMDRFHVSPRMECSKTTCHPVRHWDLEFAIGPAGGVHPHPCASSRRRIYKQKHYKGVNSTSFCKLVDVFACAGTRKGASNLLDPAVSSLPREIMPHKQGTEGGPLGDGTAKDTLSLG